MWFPNRPIWMELNFNWFPFRFHILHSKIRMLRSGIALFLTEHDGCHVAYGTITIKCTDEQEHVCDVCAYHPMLCTVTPTHVTPLACIGKWYNVSRSEWMEYMIMIYDWNIAFILKHMKERCWYKFGSDFRAKMPVTRVCTEICAVWQTKRSMSADYFGAEICFREQHRFFLYRILFRHRIFARKSLQCIEHVSAQKHSNNHIQCLMDSTEVSSNITYRLVLFQWHHTLCEWMRSTHDMDLTATLLCATKWFQNKLEIYPVPFKPNRNWKKEKIEGTSPDWMDVNIFIHNWFPLYFNSQWWIWRDICRPHYQLTFSPSSSYHFWLLIRPTEWHYFTWIVTTKMRFCHQPADFNFANKQTLFYTKSCWNSHSAIRCMSFAASTFHFYTYYQSPFRVFLILFSLPRSAQWSFYSNCILRVI